MKGYPKILNTKQDFMNCIVDYPEETKNDLQKLLDNRYSWFDTAIISADTGTIDETHRVIILPATGGEAIQQELKEDPNARIFKLGFTVEEVEELLND